MNELVDNSILTKYLVEPSTKIKLSKWRTRDSKETDSEERQDEFDELNEKLLDLQYLFSAGHEHKMLIILQGMDAAGKDGTIRHVFHGVNPQIVDVSSFKTPTAAETDHDFLWRVHQRVPGKGEIMIFNRSHYEDVIIVRVRELISKDIWSKRFEHINNFERLLADEGTIILKFFLHISEDEQKERLKKRLNDPKKIWKFNVDDVEERKLWPQYTNAYEDVLMKTSTAWAPWYVVPSDVKWYRNLVISTILVDTLAKLKMKYPKPKISVRDVEKMIK